MKPQISVNCQGPDDSVCSYTGERVEFFDTFVVLRSNAEKDMVIELEDIVSITIR